MVKNRITLNNIANIFLIFSCVIFVVLATRQLLTSPTTTANVRQNPKGSIIGQKVGGLGIDFGVVDHTLLVFFAKIVATALKARISTQI